MKDEAKVTQRVPAVVNENKHSPSQNVGDRQRDVSMGNEGDNQVKVPDKVVDDAINNATQGTINDENGTTEEVIRENKSVIPSITPTKRLEHPTRQRPRVTRSRSSLSPRSKSHEEVDIIEESQQPEAPLPKVEEEQIVPKEDNRVDAVPVRRPAGAVALPGFGGVKFDPSAVKLKKSTSVSSPAKEEAAPVDFRSVLKKSPSKSP